MGERVQPVVVKRGVMQVAKRPFAAHYPQCFRVVFLAASEQFPTTLVPSVWVAESFLGKADSETAVL